MWVAGQTHAHTHTKIDKQNDKQHKLDQSQLYLRAEGRGAAHSLAARKAYSKFRFKKERSSKEQENKKSSQ